MAPSSLSRRRRWSGASDAPERDARTRCQRCTTSDRRRGRRLGIPCRRCPVLARVGAARRSPPSCSPPCCAAAQRAVVRSDRGVHRPTARSPGAYPDLEALVPKLYHGAPPETLDSGRNCTPASLGRSRRWGSARFGSPAGRGRSGPSGPWSSRSSARRGSTRRHWPRSTRRAPQTAARTTITAQSQPTVAGPAGPSARHRDRRADPDGRHLAGGRARRRQRGHHQRPARSADPGRDRRVRGTLMFRFLARHGLVRLIGGRPCRRSWLGPGRAGQQRPPDPGRRAQPASRRRAAGSRVAGAVVGRGPVADARRRAERRPDRPAAAARHGGDV